LCDQLIKAVPIPRGVLYSSSQIDLFGKYGAHRRKRTRGLGRRPALL